MRAMQMEDGETQLFDVKLTTVKAGALRMFLGFWVMGQKGWVGNQAEDGTIRASITGVLMCMCLCEWDT